MAAAPVPQPDNPQAGTPPQGASASPQANPLQEMLGRLAISARQLGSQNVVIQTEMQQISALAVQALQKVSQAAAGPAQPAAAPPQQ